ncbi:MAG: lipopolysaccharide biosynthesis protein, partial [Pseudolabrys sp.]
MALLRHSGIYFLARTLAGGASFALIAAYTRLLGAQEFGELALLLAGVGFFTLLIGDTPILALLRYLPGQSATARATMLWGLILPAAGICGVAALAFAIAAPPHWRIELVIAAGLLLATLLHRFQLATAQGTLKPVQYAMLGSLESILDMALGIALVWLGYGVAGAMLGTMLGALVTLALNWRGWWIGRTFFDPVLGRQMLRFAVPL